MKKRIKAYMRNGRRRSFRNRLLRILSCVVVFVTTYALLIPAITMEQTAACGFEAHQHDPSCFEQHLVCGLEETDGHQHTDDCYTVSRILTCTKNAHSHAAECFDDEGNLTCALAEHTHDDGCWQEDRVLICEKEEAEAHRHTDACYASVLVCRKPVHVHSPECYVERSLDLARYLRGDTTVYVRANDADGEAGGWLRVDDTAEITASDLVRLYYAYTIPAGTLTEENRTVRYPLPENIRLTDDQIREVNAMNGGRGAQAVEGTRTPDRQQTGDEYVSAWILFENICSESIYTESIYTESIYTENIRAESICADPDAEQDDPAVQNLVLTFDDAAIEKNRKVFGPDGALVDPGNEVSGFFSIDVDADQILFDRAGDSDREKETLITLVREDENLGVSGISRKIRLTGNDGDEGSSLPNDELAAAEEDAAAADADAATDGAAADADAAADGAAADADAAADGTAADADTDTAADGTTADADTAADAPAHAAADETALEKQALEEQDPEKQNQPDQDCSAAAAEERSGEKADATVSRGVAHALRFEGPDYTVTASYTEDTGIPAGASLVVSEITEGGDRKAYEDYCGQAEEAVSREPGRKASWIRLFDISIVDQEDHSLQYQPAGGSTVDVKIALADAEEGKDLSVVHFAGEGEAGEVMESVTESGEEGQVVRFEADGFSVYAVVDLPQMEKAVLATDTPFYLANSQGGIEYMTNEVITQNVNPLTALNKTTDIAGAGKFYFEAGGSDGTYYIYTFPGENEPGESAPTKYYVSFQNYDANGARLYLSSEKEEAAQKVTVSTVSSESGKYYFAWNNGQKDYYINKFSQYTGTFFACWAGAGNAGSQFQLISAPVDTQTFDPLGIDGKSCLIVDQQNRSLGTTSKTVNGKSMLTSVPVSKNSEGHYETEEDDAVSVWTFHAGTDGTYTISTYVDGGRKYLHADANNNLTVSDEPTRFTLDSSTDRLVLYTENNKVRLYSNNNGFGVRTNKAPTAEEQFLLAAAGARVIYSYVPHSNEETNSTLTPSTKTDVRTENYKVREPSVSKYTALHGGYRCTFTFQGWQGSDGHFYLPGDPIDDDPDGGVLVLTSVWEEERSEELTYTISYDLNIHPGSGKTVSNPPKVPGAHLSADPADGTWTDSVSGAFAAAYAALGLDVPRYATDDNKAAYAFTGWKTESGRIIQASDTLDLAREDVDGDGVVRLTAQWSNQYSDRKQSREVHFFLSIKALSADVFHLNPQLSTASGDFTSEVFATLMQPDSFPADLPQAQSNSAWRYLVNYQPAADADSTTTDIAEADRRIRMLGADGLPVQGTTFQTIDFPDDEAVFANISRFIKSGQKITLDGKIVPAEDLTAENFTIRWYVCKLQGDCWHIDGKLTPRVSFAAVTKTFAGNETALANIPNDYQIRMTEDRSDASGAASRTLVLTDRTQNPENYGLLTGTLEDGTFGYIRKSGSTYTWLIPVARGTEYSLTEENYDITVEGVKYGIAAQYSITGSFEGDTNAEMQQWLATVPCYSSTLPVTEIDFHSIKTTNLYNTYVETGVFMIQKRDAGTNFAAMPGVPFRVYEVTGAEEERLLTVSKKAGSSDTDGRYTVLYENGNYSDAAVTGSDGNIYLTLPTPPDEGPDDSYTFRIEEDVPAGYRERPDAQAPSFKVSVDRQGRYTILADPIKPEGGEISETRIGTPGAAGTTVTGVLMTNQPERLLSVTVQKNWESADPADPPLEKPVTVILRGRAGENVLVQRTIELDENNGWTQRLVNDLPLVIGNQLVRYEIEETKIGEYAAGSDGFQHWNVRYSTPVFKDKDGTELARDGVYVAAAHAHAVRSIDFSLTNEELDSSRVDLSLVKKGDEKKDYERLTTAVFQLYEADPSSASEICYNDTMIRVKDLGLVTSTEQAKIRLRPDRDYYLQEVQAPAQYQRSDHFIHIQVAADGVVTVPEEVDDYGQRLSESMVELGQETAGSRDAVLTVYNTLDPAVRVVLKKVGYKNTDPQAAPRPLTGAKFRIHKDSISGPAVATDSQTEYLSAGQEAVFFEGALEKGVTYYLEETQVPEGYCRPVGNYYFRISEDGVSLHCDVPTGQSDYSRWVTSQEDADGTTYVISIPNTAGYELPSTGGPGTGLIRLLGTMLAVLAGAALLAKGLLTEK